MSISPFSGVCATLLNNKTGILTSDNYPSAYPDNGDCVWLIRVPSGKVRRQKCRDAKCDPKCLAT